MEGHWSRVPLQKLEAVVIVGGAQVTTEALEACASNGVNVTSLAGNGRVRYQAGHGMGGNVHLRLRQIQGALDFRTRDQVARWLVAGKLANCRQMLKRWWWDARSTDRRYMSERQARVAACSAELVSAADGNAIRGCEGEGTRLYFEGLRRHLRVAGSKFSFDVRTRRPPRDPVNATLGFVYGLVLGPFAGALEAVGLDPQVGFLHGVRPGRPSLALDVLEEFRPAIADRFVAGLFTRRMLTEIDFVTTPGGACYLAEAGRRKLLYEFDQFKRVEAFHPPLRRAIPRSALPLTQATLMARFLRGDLPAYASYVMES